jgi:hypothetical protein
VAKLVLALIKKQRNVILADVQSGRVGVNFQLVLKNVELEFRPEHGFAKYLEIIKTVSGTAKKRDHVKALIVPSVSFLWLIIYKRFF